MSLTPSLRLRLIGLFVLTALVVAAVIIFAVERFSAAALMDLMMEGSDSPEEAQLMFDQYVGRVLLIGAGVAVVLGSLTGWWFLRRILRPLDRLAEATHAVAAGDLETRVPVPPDPELRSLAESFNRMTASLERAEMLRRALVEDVAHELRTPLTSLRGYTEALADGVVEPTSDMLRTVHEEIVRLTRLVEELDQLARGLGGAKRAIALAEQIDRGSRTAMFAQPGTDEGGGLLAVGNDRKVAGRIDARLDPTEPGAGRIEENEVRDVEDGVGIVDELQSRNVGA